METQEKRNYKVREIATGTLYSFEGNIVVKESFMCGGKIRVKEYLKFDKEKFKFFGNPFEYEIIKE